MGGIQKGITILLVVASLILPGATRAADKTKERIVARVGEIKLPLSELRQYARKRPDLAVYLNLPHGGRKLAEIWTQERLVTLHALKEQGKNPYEAINTLTQNEITELYIQTVKKELIPPKPVTEEDAKEAYQNRPQDYAVPARIELKQMIYPLSGKSNSKPADVRKILEKAGKEIEQGGDFNAVYQKAKTQIPTLAEHDFGFIPLDGSYVGEDAVKNLEPGKTRLFETKEAIFLFYTVTKRPAVLEPFDTIKTVIMNDLNKKRTEESWNNYIDGLKKEFEVEILL